MCEACSPPREPVFVGKSIMLQPPEPCLCSCLEFTYQPDGKRCMKCNHLVKITVEGVDDSEWDRPLWIDPETKHPVLLTEAVGHGK